MTSDLHGDEAHLRELVGVGCDTEERARLERTLERDSSFLERWFLSLERHALSAAPDPVGLALQLFCLKEAAIKALWAQHQVGPDSVECRWIPDAGWSLSLLPGRRGLKLEGQAGLEGDLGWARVLAWQSPAARPETGRDSSRPAQGFDDQAAPETGR